MIFTGLDAAAITEGLVPVLGPLRRKHKIVVAAVSDPRVDELAAGRGRRRARCTPRPPPSRTGCAGPAPHVRSATSGISVVQAPPETFAPALADHYLALKKAGQL